MDYSTTNGSSISVNGLESDFVLTIPNKPPPKQDRNPKYPNFITPDKDCVNHKFYVDKDKTAFEIILELAQEKFVTVYVRYGRRVTKTKYDYEYYHPDLTSCVEPPERDNCTGVEDFMDCMDLNFNDTKRFNISLNGTGLNNTLANQNATFDSPTCPNVSIPDVSFLSNQSEPRNMNQCLSYHDIATCPPCPSPPSNGSSNYTGSNNGTFLDPPGCGTNVFNNITNTTIVCTKVQRFLTCVNRTVERYEKCKSLLTKKKLIYNRYVKCHKNINRRYIGVDKFNTSGNYYIAVCYNSTQWPPPTTLPPPTTTTAPTTSPYTTANITTTDVPTTTKGGKDRRRRFADEYLNSELRIGSLDGSKSRNNDAELRLDSRNHDAQSKEREASDFDAELRLATENDYFPPKESSSDFDSELRLARSTEDTQSKERILHRNRRQVNNTLAKTKKRKCAKAEEKPAPTIPPTPTEFPPAREQIYNTNTSLNYSMEINTFCCVFRNETTNEWSSDGCRVRNVCLVELFIICI